MDLVVLSGHTERLQHALLQYAIHNNREHTRVFNILRIHHFTGIQDSHVGTWGLLTWMSDKFLNPVQFVKTAGGVIESISHYQGLICKI